MKSIIKRLFLSSVMAAALWSCTKDEKKDYFEGGTAPALTASVSDSIPLSFATKDQPALGLSWTNPDYKFTTGISSQDVNYVIEDRYCGCEFHQSCKANSCHKQRS